MPRPMSACVGFASDGRTQGHTYQPGKGFYKICQDRGALQEATRKGTRPRWDVGMVEKGRGDETEDLPGYLPPLKGCPNVIIASC
jgi:hypothetical protein